MSRQEVLGAAVIADSPDEVRVRVREQLMKGASQIKLTAGGGVASPHSPPLGKRLRRGFMSPTFSHTACLPGRANSQRSKEGACKP
jgi:imidazolonepropionase-like amidohydrolase